MQNNYGENNTCEISGGWNDTSTINCTHYCDTGANVDLIYPENNLNYTTKENITLVCQSDDNIQLKNVTLYHDISGTWQANQTKSISGTSNITAFNINVLNGTSFEWNCLAYDNISRGSFANNNWTLNVIVDNISPQVSIISPLNQTYNISSIDFNVTLDENGICEYSLDSGVTNNSMSPLDYQNFIATNSSIANGGYLVNYYCEDSVGNLNYSENISFSVNVIFPNDTNKFYIKNSSEGILAWLGDEGNIVLKGKCFSGGNCNNPGTNSFIFRNSTNNNVAFINSTGDLCISVGDCSDESASCNPARDAFKIQNSSSGIVSYIDFDGDLCLTGKLYENADL